MSNLSRSRRLVAILGLSSLISLGLFGARVISTGDRSYSFLAWNLFLAWLPLLFILTLEKLRLSRGLSWQSLALGLLWFIFLPNSFYIASDFVHLRTTDSANVLYDAAMLLSFTMNGFILGYSSLYLMHKHLLRRISRRRAHAVIMAVLLVCSFAVYLGRFLRWNTWDVVFNPAGLIFDVSDRFINPSNYPQTFSITLTFFIVLTSIYLVGWNLLNIVDDDNHPDPAKVPRGRWLDFKIRRSRN